MKQIYVASNEMEAHFVQSLLEREGIESDIQGEALEGAWANLPISETTLPSIWVEDEDVAAAQAIVAEYSRREHSGAKADPEAPHPTWKCPKCGEEVEEQFDECWNCGTEKPADDKVTK